MADELYLNAVAIVTGDRKASTSYVQRRLQLGYNRAAALVEQMERDGIVGSPDYAGKREVLLDQEQASTAIVRRELAGSHSNGGAPVEAGPAGVSSFDASTDVLTATTAGRLRSIIERLERLEEDKDAILIDMKEVFAEAKGEGYDVKVLRKVLRLRKQDRAKRQEEEAILDLYLSALGEV